MPKVLMVGDGGNADALGKALASRGASLTTKICQSDVSTSAYSRHINYAKLAVYAIRNMKNYDHIFIWQQYIGYYYLLFSLFTLKRRCRTTIYYIITKAGGVFHRRAMAYFVLAPLLRSLRSGKVIFLSRVDFLFDKVPSSIRLLMPIYVQHSQYLQEVEHDGEVSEVKYDFFSGGTSNRDYRALFDLARRYPDLTFAVACLEKDLRGIGDVPQNVRVFLEAYGSKFDELIVKSKAVVLPVIDPTVNSGQIVALRAMQAGRPVFMSSNRFAADWFPVPGWHTFFHIGPETVPFSDWLGQYSSVDLYAMGRISKEYYYSHFGPDVFYTELAEAILYIS